IKTHVNASQFYVVNIKSVFVFQTRLTVLAVCPYFTVSSSIPGFVFLKPTASSFLRQRCRIRFNSILFYRVSVDVLFAESTFIIHRLPFIVTVYVLSTSSSTLAPLSTYPRSRVPPSLPLRDTTGGGGGKG